MWLYNVHFGFAAVSMNDRFKWNDDYELAKSTCSNHFDRHLVGAIKSGHWIRNSWFRFAVCVSIANAILFSGLALDVERVASNVSQFFCYFACVYLSPPSALSPYSFFSFVHRLELFEYLFRASPWQLDFLIQVDRCSSLYRSSFNFFVKTFLNRTPRLQVITKPVRSLTKCDQLTVAPSTFVSFWNIAAYIYTDSFHFYYN